MSSDEIEFFFSDAARALDEEILRLEERRQMLHEKLGAEQIERLEALFEQRLDREEGIEVRNSLAYWERKLLWTWARLAKLHALRRDLGRSAMKHLNTNRQDDD